MIFWIETLVLCLAIVHCYGLAAKSANLIDRSVWENRLMSGMTFNLVCLGHFLIVIQVIHFVKWVAR